MEKPIFDLLTEISKTDFIDNEDKSRTTNRDKVIAQSEKQRQLNYLLQQGLISHTKDIYIITEYGYHVAKFNSWNDYLIHQKSLFDQKLKKEKYDLHISWFQSKTGWLPYLLSFISVGIALWALSISNKKSEDKEHNQSNNTSIQERIKDKDSSTKNILNETEINSDSLNVGNQ